MPLPARTALLAVAVIAALAFAAVRITHAAKHTTPAAARAPRAERSGPHGEAATTLAGFHAPPGFRRVEPCRFAERGTAEECFWTPRVLALGVGWLQRISASWPARVQPVPPGATCGRPRGHALGIVMRHCSWTLEAGAQLVAVFADSVDVPSRATHTRIGRKVLRYWRRGTEIRLGVTGPQPGG